MGDLSTSEWFWVGVAIVALMFTMYMVRAFRRGGGDLLSTDGAAVITGVITFAVVILLVGAYFTSSEAVQVELVRALPNAILFVAIGVTLFWLRRPLLEQVLPRLGSVKVMWLEVTLVKQEIEQSVSTAESAAGSDAERERWSGFDKKAQAQLLKRAAHAAPVLRGATLLWVDDTPEGNNTERNILARFGIATDLARASDPALRLLKANPATYDVVISNIKREAETDQKDENAAGRVFLRRMRSTDLDHPVLNHPVIFYVRKLKPESEKEVPPYAFGITNRPDELFHLVFDALERTRPWGSALALPVVRAQDV